jgi:hypothetical protein
MDRGLAGLGQLKRVWFFEKQVFCQGSNGAVKNPAFQ